MDKDVTMTREQTQADANKHRVVKHAGLGLRLRNARESLSLSEKEVASRLHLNSKIISILENEDFENGPPATFLRGYLRSYARMLSIPDEEINSALVTLETTAPQMPSLDTMPVLKTSRQNHNYDYLRWMTYVVVAILMTMVSMWWVSHPRDTTSFMKATSPSNNMAATTETSHAALASIAPTPTTPTIAAAPSAAATPTETTAKAAETTPAAPIPPVASNPAPVTAAPVAPATPAASAPVDVANSAPATPVAPTQPSAPVQTAKKADKNLGDMGMALAEPGLEPSSDPVEHSTHQPVNSDSDSIY